MLRSVGQINNGAEDDNADSGAETAESDCSKMSSSSSDVMCPPGRDPPLIAMHVLANPGDSLLFEHALDHLLGWLCPGLHFFHVSERACPLRSRTRSRPGYPSLAVTLFLHESRGQERILQVLDSLQRPPWSYHHTESGRAGGIHAADAGPRPYLLSSRDFYSLGPGMPVWAVRTVHCGSELLRVTLHCSHADFEDAVRLYETVLRRGAEQQKPGFCWFALRLRPGLHLQLALKQLAPAVRVEPCDSAVLQFQVEEIGQLVPLLPNPCTPISATRWQTEDLDGNKILFQVKGLLCHATAPISAFQLNGSISLCKPLQTQAGSPSSLELQQKDPGLSTTLGAQGLYRWPAGLAADSRCSTPAGSSCYSSQCSSPGALQGLLPEEGETDVDTGCAISPTRDGPAVLENFATELQASLPASKASTRPHCRPGGTIHSLGLSCPRRELPALLHPCNTQAGGCMPQEEEFFI